MPNSYKIGVKTAGDRDWCSNGVRFASIKDATDYAFDLAMRWTAVRDWTVLESDDPPNREDSG